MTVGDERGQLQARMIADASKVFEELAARLGDAPTAGDNGRPHDGGRPGDAPTAGGDGRPSDPGPLAGEPAAAGDPVGEQQLRAAGARLLDLFAGLFSEGLEAYLELARQLLQAPPGGAPQDGGARLALGGRQGARAAATVWVHASPGQPAGELALRMTALHAADGGRIDASLALFVPAVVHVETGASAASILTVAIPRHTPAGSYFGHVLVSGAAPGGLALELTVDPAPA